MHDITNCTVEELGHTSEIGLAARAPTLAGLFRCLAQAMIALTGVGVEPQPDAPHFEVDLAAVDLPSLLVDWLNEVLYLHEVAGVVPATIEVDAISPTAIAATIHGGQAHGVPELQIKAVTYHQLQIGQEDEHWQAEVFFDI